MAATQADKPLESLSECTDWILSGRREPHEFKIGTEYERLAIDADGHPLPYEGAVSIRTLFDRLMDRHAWVPYLESGRPIALLRPGASISLEPAGQFELSGAVHATVAEMQRELHDHLAQLRDVAEDLGVQLCHVGMNPLTTLDDVPKMPKGRYAVMRTYMPRVGRYGLHMMHLTCTVQTNLDFASGSQAMEMMRLGHLLSPVLIALFANSPQLSGRETGYASFRAQLWTDVDNARCNVQRFVFDKGATVQDYVDWALDVPLYFFDKTLPDGSHGYESPLEPVSFRQYFQRGHDGRRPTMADWELHVSTMFPDVRLKRYLELRQADIVPPDSLPALPALTKGLFYDAEARAATLALLRDGDVTVDRAALREAACKDALEADNQGFRLREMAAEVLRICQGSLTRQAAATGLDLEAGQALAPLEAIVAGHRLPFYETVRRRLAARHSLLALADGW